MGVLGEKDDFSTGMPVGKVSSREISQAEEGVLASEQDSELHRALKARHITMIGMRSPRRSTRLVD